MERLNEEVKAVEEMGADQDGLELENAGTAAETKIDRVPVASLKIVSFRDVDDVHVQDAVAAYRALWEQGFHFPPVKVFRDAEGALWLGDGALRARAASEAGVTDIDAEIVAGSQADAALCFLRQDEGRPLRLKNADKRRAVLIFLRNSDLSDWSNIRIAEACGVSDHFVGDLRRELDGDVTPNGSESREGRDGRTTNTGKIGKRPKTKKGKAMPEMRAAGMVRKYPKAVSVVLTAWNKSNALSLARRDDGAFVLLHADYGELVTLTLDADKANTSSKGKPKPAVTAVVGNAVARPQPVSPNRSSPPRAVKLRKQKAKKSYMKTPKKAAPGRKLAPTSRVTGRQENIKKPDATLNAADPREHDLFGFLVDTAIQCGAGKEAR